jgi:hypothetical protein
VPVRLQKLLLLLLFFIACIHQHNEGGRESPYHVAMYVRRRCNFHIKTLTFSVLQIGP